MGSNSGYIFSGVAVVLAAAVMSFIDVHRRNVRRKKRRNKVDKNRSVVGPGIESQQKLPLHRCHNPAGLDPINFIDVDGVDDVDVDAEVDRNSFSEQDDILPPMSLLSHQRSFVYDDLQDLIKKRETLASDEGLDDLDMPEEYLMDDFDYLDNITSCNKVENCLMLSEYEQNLIKENESPNLEGPRKWSSRKWSMFKTPTMPTINSESEDVSGSTSGIETNKSVSENSEFSRDIFSGFSRKSLRSKFIKRSTSQQQQQQHQHQCQHQQQQHQQPTANVVSNKNSS